MLELKCHYVRHSQKLSLADPRRLQGGMHTPFSVHCFHFYAVFLEIIGENNGLETPPLGLTSSLLGNLGSTTDSKAYCPTFNLCLISCHRNCQFMVNVNNVCPIIIFATFIKKVTKCMGIPFRAMYLHQHFETHVHSNCPTIKGNMVFAFNMRYVSVKRGYRVQANTVVCWLVVELAFMEPRDPYITLWEMAFTLVWCEAVTLALTGLHA